jgi:hypothetical protein
MKLRQRLVATVGALTLAGLAVLPGYAATSSDSVVDVQVTGIPGGTVAVTISETGAFNDVVYNVTSATTSNGTLTVTASDNRGTAAGWTVSLKATDFIQGNTAAGSNIAISNLSLTPGSATRTSGVGTIPTATTAQTPVTNAGGTLWVAAVNQGDGVFALPLSGTLNVPAGTLVDTYTSTVTADITAAP